MKDDQEKQLDLDQELVQILEAANQRSPSEIMTQPGLISAGTVWPWEVPQAPTYTSGGSASQ